MLVDMVLYQNHVHVVIPIGCSAMFLNKALLYNLGWPHDLFISTQDQIAGVHVTILTSW